MAGKGEIYKRSDGKWAFRVKAGNGEIVATLKVGEELAVEADAGSVLVEFRSDSGEILASAEVAVTDGELASLSAVGSPDNNTAEVVIQRYSGLSTPPPGVPTGDSGLLGLGHDDTGLNLVYAMMALLAFSGGIVALRRRRSLP